MGERFVIRQGDTTTTGGRVLAGSPSLEVEYAQAARLRDPVQCPRCGTDGQIAEGNPTLLAEGLPVAGAGHLVNCACPPGSHRLVAGQFSVSMGEDTVGLTWTPPSLASGTVVRLGSLAALGPIELEGQRLRFADNEPAEEEEEEELPQEDGITLRLGLFFDGTANNQANSESAAGCRAGELSLADAAEDIRRQCAAYGYDGAGNAPDNSYGNAVTNVARLYGLYPDQADQKLIETDKEVFISVYLEGIGTSSGEEDSLYSQGTGGGSTGVLARVEQGAALIIRELRRLQEFNPDLKVRRILCDLFGFSRGAAAARHCANDLLKGPDSLLAQALPAGIDVLAEDFTWQPGRDLQLNFIGLFDTVPGIVAPLHGALDPHEARYPELNLHVRAGMARQIAQLVARDERRYNFSLLKSPHDIVLPGSHSDIGGGYLPLAVEKLLLSRPRHSQVPRDTAAERTFAYQYSLEELRRQLPQLEPYAQQLGITVWERELPRRRDEMPEKRVYAAIHSERKVQGELSLIYLRIMRELGVRAGIPFRPLADVSELRLPAELLSIHDKLQAYALGESAAPNLSAAEEALLRLRYIHLSAHWNAAKGLRDSEIEVLFINRPTEDGRRTEHDDD